MSDSASRTARGRAKAEMAQTIKDEARRQLADGGPQALSVRAVSRSLGVVSSAIYRYFPSRDDLLTALIIDAYNSLGDAAERADVGTHPIERWQSVCIAVRTWAKTHRHEYELIYGSPVPGYQAPEATIVPAGRVPRILVGLLDEAHTAKVLTVAKQPEMSATLRAQADTVSATLGVDLPRQTLHRLMIAWTQLFGMISFELFGHLAGSADPADDFFLHTTARMAEFVGL